MNVRPYLIGAGVALALYVTESSLMPPEHRRGETIPVKTDFADRAGKLWKTQIYYYVPIDMNGDGEYTSSDAVEMHMVTIDWNARTLVAAEKRTTAIGELVPLELKTLQNELELIKRKK